jgi:hypothetical protein
MHISRSTNNKYLAIIMIALLSLSCPVKREIKQWLQIETPQQTMGSSCPRTCYTNSNDHILSRFVSKQREVKALFPFSIRTKCIDKFALLNNVDLHGFSIFQKQKIPSFLLFRKLLI